VPGPQLCVLRTANVGHVWRCWPFVNRVPSLPALGGPVLHFCGRASWSLPACVHHCLTLYTGWNQSVSSATIHWVVNYWRHSYQSLTTMGAHSPPWVHTHHHGHHAHHHGHHAHHHGCTLTTMGTMLTTMGVWSPSQMPRSPFWAHCFYLSNQQASYCLILAVRILWVWHSTRKLSPTI